MDPSTRSTKPPKLPYFFSVPGYLIPRGQLGWVIAAKVDDSVRIVKVLGWLLSASWIYNYRHRRDVLSLAQIACFLSKKCFELS